MFRFHEVAVVVGAELRGKLGLSWGAVKPPNDVIYVVLKSAGVTAIGTISHTIVSRIIAEGYIAAQIQLRYELGDADSMCIIFHADVLWHTDII